MVSSTVSSFLFAAVTTFTTSTHAVRVHTNVAKMLNRDEAPVGDVDKWSCCCKRGLCSATSNQTSTSNPVYSPGYGVCCKFKSYHCGSIMNGRTSYTDSAMTKEFCLKPQEHSFGGGSEPATADVEPLRPVEDLQEGSPEHTVQSYCKFDSDVDVEDEGTDAQAPPNGARDAVVRALVDELSQNSIDTMAKEIFSMYVCTRWAPDSAFVSMAKGEMRTGQLPEKPVDKHFNDFTFIPLRCSRNFNVYGNNPKLGDTHFDEFEKEMLGQSHWYQAEGAGVVAARLAELQNYQGEALLEAAALFDVKKVEKVVSKCIQNGASPNRTLVMTLDVMSATPEAILGDCAAAKWWLQKMLDWEKAMPFSSFMSPDAAVVKETKPKSNEHALVCFGKRVASQLHRRAEGSHLITDQSMVGCHGFWDFKEAGQMLQRIVTLWRPPTCQLAAMELDMKIKIMELIATMNKNLFDALPAMLDDEAATKVTDDDGVPLARAGMAGAVRGVANTIGGLFSSMSSRYVRLGQLLGNTVVKWVVCPLKPINDPKRLKKLDQALGTEDDLSRYYAQIAYAKWTGKKNLLPGEECKPYQVKDPAPQMPQSHLERCSLGEMRENMPERYKDEEFICPVRPLLPAVQQLEILQKKSDVCALRINPAQQKAANWIFHGRKPHVKQYEVMSNFPEKHFQKVKILDMASHYDSTYYITRTFVTVGRGCTEEIQKMVPRYCSKPDVVNEPSITRDLLTGIATTGGAAINGVGTVLELTGVKEKTPPNSAYTERLMGWLYNKAKASEKWIRSGSDGFMGRSGGRYQRLRQRLFDEVEAAELLHSLSYQDMFSDSGSDSQHNKRFDRFSVMAPCVSFDPNTEFRLKYTWSEKAMSVARKAFKTLPSDFASNSRGARMQLRGSGVFHMRDASTAWMTYFAHVRAATMGGEFSQWRQSNNPFITELAGIFDSDGDAHVDAGDILGFEVTLACGTKQEMHDLPSDFDSLSGNFRDCVKKGKESNEKNREAHPDMPVMKEIMKAKGESGTPIPEILPDQEVVVRATFKPLSACHKDSNDSTKLEEKVNPVYKNFEKITGCEGLNDDMLPDDLKTERKQGHYRGMLLGKGLPEETLTEVLIDPADFLEEVRL